MEKDKEMDKTIKDIYKLFEFNDFGRMLEILGPPLPAEFIIRYRELEECWTWWHGEY